MKTSTLLLVSILFLAVASSARAQIITQTDSFSNLAVSSSMSIPLTFNAFNSSLGTLNQVNYSLTGTLNVNGYLTRSGAYNVTLNLPYRLQGGASQLDAETISSNITGTAPSAGYTITDPYAISIQVDNLSTTITPTSLYFPSALQNTHTGNNTLSISSDTISGTMTLTYNYTPAVVPEPTTWAMLLGGLGLLALRRARRA
jgi:hypothetical protein